MILSTRIRGNTPQLKNLFAMIAVAAMMLAPQALAQESGIGERLYAFAATHKPGELAAYFKTLAEKEPGLDRSEQQLNALGYRFLGEGRHYFAIEALKLNLSLFPNSVNAHDSLAEAYMTADKRDLAKRHYKKAMGLLADAALPQQQKDFLKMNARRKLIKLNKADKPDALPAEIVAFLGDGPGKLHPDAPAETEQFGRLAGLWKITNHALVNGQWFSGYEAYWGWRYMLGGFAIADMYYQPEENLPPNFPMPRDNIMLQTRVYNPATRQWWIGFANNNATFASGAVAGTFDAAMQENGELVMRPNRMSAPPQAGAPLSRIVFYNVGPKTFQWRMDYSNDDGKTWETRFKVDAKRIPLPGSSLGTVDRKSAR